ncbi:hypothetical protein ACW73L_21670 [Methylolobus aquaticus]
MDPLEAPSYDLKQGGPHATNISDFGGQIANALCGDKLQHCSQDQKESKTLRVLAVFVRGGPYAEAIEERRRARYALISGLAVSNYEPEDAEHIRYLNFSGQWKYFDPPIPRVASQSERKLPDIIPYEWFKREKESMDSMTRDPLLVIWLDESALGRTPLKKLRTLRNLFTYTTMQSVYESSLPDLDRPVDPPGRPSTDKPHAKACVRGYGEGSDITLMNRKILEILFPRCGRLDERISELEMTKGEKDVVEEAAAKADRLKRIREVVHKLSDRPVQDCAEFLGVAIPNYDSERRTKDISNVCKALVDTTLRELESPTFDWTTALAPSPALQILGRYTYDVLKTFGEKLKNTDRSGGNTDNACPETAFPAALAPPDIDFRVLGPSSSDTLEGMRQEALEALPTSEDSDKINAKSHDLKDPSLGSNKKPASSYFPFKIFSPQASAEKLLEQSDQKGGSAAKAFSTVGIEFNTTALSDTHLAKALRAELDLRGYIPSRHFIAFVGEWDTFYGRALKETFSKEFFGGKLSDRLFYSYLRGLDGEGRTNGKYSRKASNGNGKGADTFNEKADFFRATTEDQSLGDDQIDFLRRIADDIAVHDQELQAKEGRSIWAIGLIGTDVYDKILIMEALRSRFPQALFFTTELDARYSDNGAQGGKTRNLLVASSYGLELDQVCQQFVPAFRGWAQTSLFLATQLAVGGPCAWVKNSTFRYPSRVFQPHKKVNLFEIGRTRPIILEQKSSDPIDNSGSICEKVASRQLTVPTDGQGQSSAQLSTGYLDPPGWPIGHGDVSVFVKPLAAFLIYLAICLFVWSIGVGLKKIALASVAALFFITLTASLEAVTLISAEPFVWLEGVSIWPTEFLRLAAFFLMVLVLRCKQPSRNIFEE